MSINIPRTRRIKNGSDIVNGKVSVFSNKIGLFCHFVADEIAAEERNEYCQSKTKAGCTAPVYALFDGEPSNPSKRWRCYFSEAVTVNDMGQVEYDTSTNSNCYVTIEEADFFDIIWNTVSIWYIWLYRLRNRPMVRESKQVLDSGFHTVDSGFQALDSSLFQWNLDSGFQSFWYSDFLSCFPDSKAQDSGFHKQSFPDYGFHEQEFPRIRNPDSLSQGNRNI